MGIEISLNGVHKFKSKRKKSTYMKVKVSHQPSGKAIREYKTKDNL